MPGPVLIRAEILSGKRVTLNSRHSQSGALKPTLATVRCLGALIHGPRRTSDSKKASQGVQPMCSWNAEKRTMPPWVSSKKTLPTVYVFDSPAGSTRTASNCQIEPV